MKDEVTTMQDPTHSPAKDPTQDPTKDATSEPTHEPASDLANDSAKEPGKPGRSGRLQARLTPHLALAVAALLLLAAGAIGVTKARPYYAARDQAEQGAAALAAGRQLAVNFVTMDYRTFDSYGSQVLNGASGSFRSDYAAKLTDLKKVIVANQTRSSVKQVEAGLVSSDSDSAAVIVGLVAPTSNTATPKAVDKTYRLRLDLHRTSDANSPWKVINLEFVG
jgi:Mce-associated membrane protein